MSPDPNRNQGEQTMRASGPIPIELASNVRLTPRQRLAAEAEPALDALFRIIDGVTEFGTVHWSAKGDRKEYPGLFPSVVIGVPSLEAFQDGNETLYFTDSETLEASWPLDFSGIVVDKDGGATIARARAVTARQVRGRVIRPYPKMVQHTICCLNDAGRAVVASEYWGIRPDWSLVDISNIATQQGDHYLHKSRGNEEKQQRIQLAAGAQLTHRYLWHVNIRAAGSRTPLRIPTTGQGALALLSLRDVEQGAQRRRALRHWVRAHIRTTATAEVDVSEHLRGLTPFSWGDYEGFVEPPAHDVERLEAKTNR